jgi:hypothetical protein
MSSEAVTLEGLMMLVHRYGNREWQAGYADAEGKEATEQKWRTKADETRNEIRAYAVRMLAANGVMASDGSKPE